LVDVKIPIRNSHFFHGLAHLSGFLASWTSTDAGYASKPWIFSSGIYLQSWAGRFFGLFWLIAVVGFIGSTVGISLSQGWWMPLVVASSAVSLLVIVPWWNTVPPGAKVGAVFDSLIILALITPLQKILLEVVQ
jgi:hypothetical protein